MSTEQPAGPPDERPAEQTTEPAHSATLRALAGEDFAIRDVFGGPRGVLESIGPGLVFVVVYVATRALLPSLLSAAGLALVLLVIRLAQRTPITQALSGFAGVAIGVVWAALTGRAQDYFAGGFITNLVILAVALVSILVRWPIVGVARGLVDGSSSWREDAPLRRRATWASWLWVALPLARIAVQWPMFLGGAESVGWLGVARLVMGLPLTALVVWLSWRLVRRPAGGEAPPQPPRP